MDPYRDNGGCFGGKLLPSPSKKKMLRNLASTLSKRSGGSRYPLRHEEYVLYEEVGLGRRGIVYRALCAPSKEIVAIKVVDLDKSSNALDAICYELQTMALIDHPNILKAHCSFVVGYNLWVVMPYMAGGSCLHLMNSIYPEGFKELVIAAILRDVLKALYYLHMQGQIHQNVKAGNILVDANGTVILSDFGVSTCTFDIGDAQCCTNSFAGTSCWLAPELKDQRNSCGPQVDIWSFGVTALELSQGHAELMKYPPMKVLQTALKNVSKGNDYERQKRLSKSFLKMIAKCLRMDPTERPSAKKLLKTSFFLNAPSTEVVMKTVFNGLPSLGDQLKALKLKEAGNGEKNIPCDEKNLFENGHKGEISAWNLNMEELNVQTSSMQDDDERDSQKVIQRQKSMNERHPVVIIESVQAETNGEGRDSTQVQSISQAASAPFEPPNAQKKYVDAPVNNSNCCSIPEMKYIKFDNHKQVELQLQKDEVLKAHDTGHALEKECNLLEGSHSISDQCNNACSEPQAEDKRGHVDVSGDSTNYCSMLELKGIAFEDQKDEVLRALDTAHALEKACNLLEGSHNVSDQCSNACNEPQAEDTRSEVQISGRNEQEPKLERNSNRSSNSQKTVVTQSPDCIYSQNNLSSNLDSLGEKSMVPAVQTKGRFRITSENVDPEQNMPLPRAIPFSISSTSNVATSTIFPVMQSISERNAAQRQQIIGLIKSLSQGRNVSVDLSNPGSKSTSCNGLDNLMFEAWSERERELLQQVADLQNRIANLADEIQKGKMENIQLELQLTSARQGGVN